MCKTLPAKRACLKGKTLSFRLTLFSSHLLQTAKMITAATA